METAAAIFGQKLDARIGEADRLRKSYAERLGREKNLMDVYAQALPRLRELNISDPRRGEANPKEFIRMVGAAPPEAIRAIAFKAPSDGVAKALMKHLPALGLNREDALSAVLLCIQEDCEQCIPFLAEAGLAAEDAGLALLAAIKTHPAFNYEEFKTQEVMFQTANTEDSREMMEIQRRFEQARGKKIQHVRKHVLNYIPEVVKAQPHLRGVLLLASLRKDTFGTLEVLRETASQEALKSTTNDLLAGIPTDERLGLLEMTAELGMGLASNYLDIFGIPDEPEWHHRLREILIRDITAGHSLFGAYALEGVQHYPFGLGRIEPMLPRRVTNAEAAEYLKRSGPEGSKPRTHSANEIAEVVAMLQEKDVRRFLENLKWGIARNWKDLVGDRKREVVFGDYDLKVRDILFLVAHSLFDREEKFDNIYEMVEKNHPFIVSEPARLYLLANRCYFLDLLGLNASFLFSRQQRPGGSKGTPIEEIGDYQARYLLHLGMSIFIRIGDAIFRDMPIAWTMLIGQCDGKIDTAFHEVALLFDSFDTLLAIADPIMKDMPAWVGELMAALSEDAPSMPPETAEAPTEQAQLRVTTRATIARIREGLHRYCLDALHLRAKAEGATPISIVQTLKMPRSKTDKLMTLIQNDPRKTER